MHWKELQFITLEPVGYFFKPNVCFKVYNILPNVTYNNIIQTKHQVYSNW